MKRRINEDFVIVINSEPKGQSLKVDFLPIEKLFKSEFDEFQRLLSLSLPIRSVIKKFTNFKFLLGYYDYCEVISSPYQGVPNYSNYGGLRKLLSYQKEDLIEFFTTRLNAYRIENTYILVGSSINKGQVLAFSHKRVGWTAEPFHLSDKFQIQFNTNFGYGNKSYFYLVIQYKNITVIPYSDWIIYKNASIYEILGYTRKYQLKDESWLSAMEDCKNLYNLSISDESKFVEKHIIDEAKKMVEGLKNIMKYDKFKLLYLNKDETTIKYEGYKIIEYRAEKVSGALKFITHLKNFSAIRDISDIINELKNINKELLPILKREHELITERLNKIEPDLVRLELIVKNLEDRYKKITTRHNEINDQLHKKYKTNYDKKDRTEEIEKLLLKEMPNWRTENEEYYNIHKEYNPLKQEKNKLTPSKEAIEKYIIEIDNYFEHNR
jgi:hypothetical protein